MNGWELVGWKLVEEDWINYYFILRTRVLWNDDEVMK